MPDQNPFSQDNINKSFDPLAKADKGGEVVVSVDKDKNIEASVDVAVVSTDKVTWTVGGWAKGKWNQTMDWAGMTRLKW